MIASDPRPAVVVVDDDPAVATSLARLFRSAGWRCDVFTSADELLAATGGGAGPTCLVMDLRIDDVDGVELYQRLRAARRQPPPAVFITGYGDVRSGVRAMKAGAMDFLEKPVDTDVLIAVVARALEADAAAAAARAALEAIDERLHALSADERAVMRLLVAGRSNKQIAGTLGMRERTVKTLRANVMRKLCASSLADVVCLGLALGWEDGERGRGADSPA